MASHKYNYFDALTEMTDFCCQAARYLDNVVKNYDFSILEKNIEQLHEIEHAADEKRHEIMKHLAKEFLPPIEREDIMDLASKIDDVTDSIDDIMQHFYLYGAETLIDECTDFSGLILRCCESIKSIAKEFSNFRKSQTIHGDIIVTNNLESEGDKLYSQAMRRIFASEMSDKETIIWARLIASLEDCCDYCEEVSELFESAIMKNS